MILYTPLPPELTVEHTHERMARLDCRLADPAQWPADPSLLVQDSARLLGAYLTVCTNRGEWNGDPLNPAAGHALTEAAWLAALRLDTVPTVHLGQNHLDALRHWTAGVVTLFAAVESDPVPRVSRLLNLGTFLDRLELEFLLDSGLSGVWVLRAHRLEDGGQMTLWRAGRPTDCLQNDVASPEPATLLTGGASAVTAEPPTPACQGGGGSVENWAWSSCPKYSIRPTASDASVLPEAQ